MVIIIAQSAEIPCELNSETQPGNWPVLPCGLRIIVFRKTVAGR